VEALTLFSQTLDACESPTATVNAIKLLGVVLTWPSRVLRSLPDGQLGRAKRALLGVSNLNPNAEARELASRLADLSFV